MSDVALGSRHRLLCGATVQDGSRAKSAVFAGAALIWINGAGIF